MPKKRTTIAKSAAVEKNIETALSRLAAACTDGDQAVTVRSKSNKRLTSEVKKLNRKRGALLRRKKTFAARAKKSPTGENRRMLRSVERELNGTRKALDKARKAKASNAEELKALKNAQKRANAYKKVIARTDRELRGRRKRA